MKAVQVLFGSMLAVLSVSAFAQSTVKTEAERDQANLSARENYPVIKFVSTKTRADVVAELEAARLGTPTPSTSAKPDVVGSPSQSKVFDATLYNGA